MSGGAKASGGDGPSFGGQNIRMPNPNDPAIIAARKRLLEKAMGRGGRQSTILSDMLRGGVNGSQGMLGR